MLNLSGAWPKAKKVRTDPTYNRLLKGANQLENIELVRNHRNNPYFGKSLEERIIWRELIELELQDVDEQMERLLEIAREDTGGGGVWVASDHPGAPPRLVDDLH